MFGARFAVFVRRARVLPTPWPATRNLSFWRFHRHTVVLSGGSGDGSSGSSSCDSRDGSSGGGDGSGTADGGTTGTGGGGIVTPASCSTGQVNAAGDGCDPTCSSGTVNAAGDGCDAVCTTGQVNAARDGCDAICSKGNVNAAGDKCEEADATLEPPGTFETPGEFAPPGEFTPAKDKDGNDVTHNSGGGNDGDGAGNAVLFGAIGGGVCCVVLLIGALVLAKKRRKGGRRKTMTDTDLPEGWSMFMDESSGYPCYVNDATGETQWEKPEMVGVEMSHMENPMRNNAMKDKHGRNSTRLPAGVSVFLLCCVCCVLSNASFVF